MGGELARDTKSVKRTVVLHPIMDNYIRKTWASLIEHGFDATYSMALNCILLGAIMEAVGERGWSEGTGEAVWEFAHDQTTIDHLSLHRHLRRLGEMWGRIADAPGAAGAQQGAS
jgi:hypothetical protein